MKPEAKLSVRCQVGNANHHLWDNHGTFWCHLTVHLPDFTKERLRLSLGTGDVEQARRVRDALFARLGGPAARASLGNPGSGALLQKGGV